ncbi:MAG: radical SAM protein, partial [Candidatus Hodarchaeota archaeon]
YVKIPVFLLCDLQQGGDSYWRKILDGIKKEQIDLPIVFELFYPATKEYYEKLSHLNEISLQLSPETWSEEIRKHHGKAYSNASLEKNLNNALNAGIKKFDLYFMIGLAGQTQEEIERILMYLDKKIAPFGDKVHFFIAPLAPFLDPGALGFDFPDKYGYKRLFKSLRSHYEALTNNSWKDFLNYESTLTREEIVWQTYETADKLFDIKLKHEYLSQKDYQKKKALLHQSWKIYQQLENLDTQQDVLDPNYLPGLGDNILTTDKDLYSFGNHQILNLRNFLRFIRKKLRG